MAEQADVYIRVAAYDVALQALHALACRSWHLVRLAAAAFPFGLPPSAPRPSVISAPSHTFSHC
jgi:hypothetical protein